jgi:hypothetical protein
MPSDDQKLRCPTHRRAPGTALWIVNPIPETRPVSIKGNTGVISGTVLDETSFKVTAIQPREFKGAGKP